MNDDSDLGERPRTVGLVNGFPIVPAQRRDDGCAFASEGFVCTLSSDDHRLHVMERVRRER